MISKKEKEEKQKIIEKRIMKFLSEIMRTVGFILLAGFSMIGAYFFYFRENQDVISTILVSTIIIIMLFAMTQVKDRW